jgi:hypothetical protein
LQVLHGLKLVAESLGREGDGFIVIDLATAVANGEARHKLGDGSVGLTERGSSQVLGGRGFEDDLWVVGVSCVLMEPELSLGHWIGVFLKHL